MKPPAIPEDEELRLRSLRRMQLLSTPAEADFDRITRVAAEHFRTPIALMSLIDQHRQWFKSRVGLDVDETPRAVSFCAHAILDNEVMVIPDARSDERFADNPLVTGYPNVVFYAGLPLRNREGYKIGTLCVIDHEARSFTPNEEERLRDFGRWLQLVIENRQLCQSEIETIAELDEARRESLIDPMSRAWNRRGFSSLIEREINKVKRDGTGIALAMLDIDHFKRINDTYGHPVGDRVIILLARLLRENVRPYDVVARLGGEEFAVILPGARREDVVVLAEKLRVAVERDGLVEGEDCFTVSVGISWFDSKTDRLDEETMVEFADRALYRAKQTGRNRVVADPDHLAAEENADQPER